MTNRDTEAQIVATVRAFVERSVLPCAMELERTNTYPEDLIATMKDIGAFALLVPEKFGGVGASLGCLIDVTEELARGWMSLAGAMGGHSVVSYLLSEFGTTEQKHRYLPRLATGEIRATMALTEPSGGSDLQAIDTVARQEPDGTYVVDGRKTWISNARNSGLIALLCKTDPSASPRHKGISLLLVDRSRDYVVGRDLPKLGYRGVESCELIFDGVSISGDAVLGGVEGEGFSQMMRGLEIGRIQVAARALGVGKAALESAMTYAQERETFGKPIWRHQSIGNYLADMATSLTAARLLTHEAARIIDAGERGDLEAGMAKLFASEVAMDISLSAMRIHGGYGYSTEFPVERYFRDAPLMILGEGTNEILRGVITRQLIARTSGHGG